jgi:hypothetical protein
MDDRFKLFIARFFYTHALPHRFVSHFVVVRSLVFCNLSYALDGKSGGEDERQQ